MESGYAEVNNTRIYYEIAGNGTPVPLIHGNFGDRRHWDDQFAAFSARHSVIRYDVRGFGKSSVPIEGKKYAHHRDAAPFSYTSVLQPLISSAYQWERESRRILFWSTPK